MTAQKPAILACPHDERRKTQPEWPRFTAHCRECAITELATGPLFHQSGIDGYLAGSYRTALARIFGDDWRRGHAEVKEKREALKNARGLPL